MKSNIHKTRIIQIRTMLAERPWQTLIEMAQALNVSRWTIKDTIVAEGGDLQAAPKAGDIHGKVPTVYALPGAAPQVPPVKAIAAPVVKPKTVKPPRSPRPLPAAPAAALTDPLQAAINLLADALIDRIADRVKTGLADRIGRMALNIGETMPVDVVALVNDVCDRAQAAPAIFAEPLPTPEIPSPFAKIVPGVALGDIDIPVIRKPVEAIKKESLRKVVVIGLKAAQGTMIEREFKDCFSITNLDVDESIHRMRSVVKNADVVFIMVKFVNHKINEMCRNESTEHHLIPGGMSQLRDALTAYFVEA